MFFSIIYLITTILFPLIETFRLLKNKEDRSAQQLWAVYWGLISLILVLKWCLPFLSIKAVQVIIMLFSLWLYHNEYKGALYLKQRCTNILNNNDLTKNLLASITEWNAFLNILEQEKRQ